MSGDPKLGTERIDAQIIDYVAAKIAEEIQPEKIILFGSHARGDADQNSDLDLFVVTEAQEPSRIVRRKIDRLLWGRRFPIEVIVRTPQEVDRNLKAKNPFYLHHIFKEGKVLYEK
ncbi:MAG: nucleotidyltransferase domain-containing protein [Candidatus Latescibacteria bacterium]|jgi:predicted nucleotidyltransferase|nr:nucleotidyltransferase domain-containing protein [Candidatus Latescibacterota bacterium]